MKLNRILIAAGLLASGSAMALEVSVGKVPLAELEAMGWVQTDSKSLEFLAPNGIRYELTKGDRAIRARLEELTGRQWTLDAKESEELAFLTQQLASPSVDSPRESVRICHGSLAFNPQFTFGMADGSVISTVEWTESPPYSNSQKWIVAEAAASAPGLATEFDSVNSGGFSHQYYNAVSATAGIYPTFEPSMQAFGYFFSDDCEPYSFFAQSVDPYQ